MAGMAAPVLSLNSVGILGFLVQVIPGSNPEMDCCLLLGIFVAGGVVVMFVAVCGEVKLCWKRPINIYSVMIPHSYVLRSL